ncbi:MAG: hypothetical protein H7138_08370 [Myxococcales bacterium]|nr:hypothetical protein [Myxococcales bacterium]
MTTGAALLFASALAAGCGSKQAPASTTTTKTQTTTQTPGGEKTHSDVTEKRVQHMDGSQDVQTTTTTNAVTPAPPRN